MASYFSTMKLFGSRTPIGDVMEWMKTYVRRIKASGHDLGYEPMGLILDVPDLRELIDTNKAERVVAFFAIENGKQTIVLMGLDKEGNFIKVKDSAGTDVYLATERWGVFQGIAPGAIDKDATSLNRLFP
jgi:hypothetical protein